MAMKTTNLSLLFAGVAALGLLTGCGDDEKKKETAVKIYTTVDECKVDHAIDDCVKAIDGAQKEHVTTMPRMQTLGECVDRYGANACIPHQDSTGSWFGPAMAGFMIGHMMGNLSTPVYQPVIIHHGNAYTAGGSQLGTWRPSCGGGDYGCRGGGGGYIGVPPNSAGSAWTHGYSTTTISPSAKSGGVTTYTAPPSNRGGFGAAATTGPTVSAPKSSPPSSVSTPSAPSARGGFGAAAAGESAGG